MKKISKKNILRKATSIFTGILLLTCIHTSAQDVNFSQSFSNPLLLNPAYAGSIGCSRVATGFGGQWNNRLLIYLRTAISYDQYVPKLHSGFGIGFTHKDSPNENNINVSIYYSFNIKINENFQIRPALNLGLGRCNFNFDSSLPRPSELGNNYGNCGAGLLFRYKDLIAGISYDHLNRPVTNSYWDYPLARKLIIHANYMVDFNGKAFLTPGIIYKKQKDFEEMNYSLLLKVWKIKCGARFRQNFYNADSFTGMIGFCAKQLSIGYSYSLMVSKLSNSTTGVHEISAVFKFNCKNDKEKYRISQLDGF